MNALVRVCRRSFVAWLAMAAPMVAEIPYATDAPKPLTLEESIAAFRLPEDLRIEIVASEPLIAEPGAMAFDEFGRLFVGELHGYNLEGYYDIVELNKTGVLDEEVRRVRVEGPHLERARDEAVGAIQMLEDRDGDGYFEAGQTWAEGLPPCYGLIRAREGLIAVCPPEILYLADRDNDGRAEVRETLFSGFGFELLERGINSPRRGPDNWIYIAAGGGGGTITGPHLPAPVHLGHTDFRIRDDGSAIEPVTGTGHTFGLALTESGDRFNASTNRHALYAPPLEYRHLVRNPFVPSPGGTVDAANYDRIYPASQPDPWRLARNADPAWVKFYGERETTPNGYFTAACGPLVYRGGALPEAYLGNHFACEPANNLVHRGVLDRDGAGYSVRRAPGEEASEFLTSTDRWFRPINLEMGPDGALYIIDFYREIIEDYSAIPRHLQQRYVESLRAGYQHGRIWRITAKDAPGYRGTSLGEAPAAELLAALESENPWARETAQRLLIARGNAADGPGLRALLAGSLSPAARLHALYALYGSSACAAAGRTVAGPLGGGARGGHCAGGRPGPVGAPAGRAVPGRVRRSRSGRRTGFGGGPVWQ
jgi:putative membrane-bound dehydrogenase-like protein